MNAAKKKKQGTKGIKQIVEENEQTIVLYRNMSTAAVFIYFTVMNIFFFESFTTMTIILSALTVIVHISCYNLLKFAAKPIYTEDGKVLDSGTDLNMQGGVAEHIKDLIILTSGTQVLSLFSNYFWFLLLLAPCWALFLLWNSVLAPWFFQPNAKPEVEEKKSKKNKYT